MNESITSLNSWAIGIITYLYKWVNLGTYERDAVCMAKLGFNSSSDLLQGLWL